MLVSSGYFDVLASFFPPQRTSFMGQLNDIGRIVAILTFFLQLAILANLLSPRRRAYPRPCVPVARVDSFGSPSGQIWRIFVTRPVPAAPRIRWPRRWCEIVLSKFTSLGCIIQPRTSPDA